MTTKLIPLDLRQCQSEIKEGSFMTLGPRSFHRCTNVPVWIAIEGPRKDGESPGSMSLCDDCKKVCEGQMPDVTFRRIS